MRSKSKDSGLESKDIWLKRFKTEGFDVELDDRMIMIFYINNNEKEIRKAAESYPYSWGIRMNHKKEEEAI